MTVAGVLKAVEEIAPPGCAFPDDRVGLLVGDPSARVDRAVVTFDASLAAFQFAQDKGAQVVVAHHPVIWSPIARLIPGEYTTNRGLQLVSNAIACIAAHTNWDACPGGLNDFLAEQLGLTDIESCGSASPNGQKICRVGTLPTAMTPEQFGQYVSQKLSTAVRLWGRPSSIRRVAVCGGAGDFDWMACREAGADVLVTGEVKQHVALEASETGFCMVEAGHYATEHPSMQRLMQQLQMRLPQIEWSLWQPKPGESGRPLEFIGE